MFALACSLLLPTIWVVDAQMSTGAHFADLPAAIAAAANGDTIVVRAGTYSRFDLVGKAVTIRGEGASTTHVVDSSPVRIVNAGGTVLLSGLHVTCSPAMYVTTSRVELLDCEFVGRGGPSTVFGGGGLGVGTGALVVACRCTFVGGLAGAQSPFLFSLGGDAVRVDTGGSLGHGFVADQCILRGGDGFGAPGAQAQGGCALNTSGRVRLDRSRCRGGDSNGVGGKGVDSTLGGDVRIAGDATSYVVGGSVAGVPVASIRSVLGSATVHAPVSVVGAFEGFVQVAPELPRLQVGGAVRADGTFDAQQPVTVTLDGLVPNGLSFVGLGIPGLVPPSAPFASELLVGSAGSSFLVAPLDAAGRLQFAYTPAAFGSVLVGMPVHLQGGVVSPALGSVLTSNLDVHVAAP